MVSFSTEAIAIVTALLTAMGTAVAVLFARLLASVTQRAERAEQREDMWMQMALSLVRTGEQAVQVADNIARTVERRTR